MTCRVIVFPGSRAGVTSLADAFTAGQFVESVICFLRTCGENKGEPLLGISTASPNYNRAFDAMKREWVNAAETDRSAH